MVDYTVISQDEWQALAPQKVKQPDKWDDLILELAGGRIVSLPFADGKDRRGMRIAIARRASLHGFKTEARYTDSHMAIRRVAASPTPATDQSKQRGGRKREV